jgi:hypothetical protein
MESSNKAIYGSSGDFLRFLKDKNKDKKKNLNNKKENFNKKNNMFNNRFNS